MDSTEQTPDLSIILPALNEARSLEILLPELNVEIPPDRVAEAGATAVGANGLLLRVCAYYHDIGKLVKPEYFVENQRNGNPHDALLPSMSAMIRMWRYAAFSTGGPEDRLDG